MTTRKAMNNAKELASLLSEEELANLLEKVRSDAAEKQRLALEELARISREEREAAVSKISDLLLTATNCLREAGIIARHHSIPFTFVTPTGQLEYHDGRWQDSACYASDGWYYDDKSISRMTVDGNLIVQDNDNYPEWQSSEACW